MSKILVIAEHLDGKLNGATARAISAAVAVKPQSIDVLVLSDAPDAVAAEAAKIDGVSKVLTVARAENAHPLAAVMAPQVAKAAAGYSHVFAPSTTFGKDLAPRVAALLGVGQVSDVITTQFGYHLIKMKERIPAKTDSLAEASPEIRKYLEASAVRKMLPAYYAELKKNADVEILDPKLKEAEMPPAGQSDAVDTVPNVSKPAATTH